MLQTECVRKPVAVSVFTCCQSFLLISYNLHNLQGLHPHSFWQEGGKAEDKNKHDVKTLMTTMHQKRKL